jgi:hypothetical protein
MEKTIKKLSMVLIMVCLVISFSTPFMMFPSKVYGGTGISCVVVGGTAEVGYLPGGTPTTGATVTVTISAIEAGKQFKSIVVISSASGTVSTTEITAGVQYTFLMPTGNPTVTVTLEAIPAIVAAPRPLTPEEIVALNLTIGEQVDRYGATNNGFVRMLYDNALGRVYDGGGFGFWTGELTANTMAGSQIAYHFIFSAELAPTINSLSDNDFIAFLYQTLMNRSYDSEGYANWQQHFESGMTREEMVNYFVNSPEFAGICASFNVTP